MKRNRLSFVVGIVVCVIVMVSGVILWGGCAPKAPEVTEISFTMMASLEARGPQEELIPLCNWLEKESGGRLKIVVYPGAQLCPPPEFFDATKEGVVDMASFGVGMVAARFPLHCVALLPMLFEPPGSRCAAATLKALYEKYPELYAEFEGVKVLGFHCTGVGHINTTNKPIHTMEDFKGSVFVCVSPQSAAVVTALGAAAEMLPPPETYDALVKGVVDAVNIEYEGLFAFRWNELMKYTTEVGIMLNTDAIIMNLDKWNSLPPDLQKLLSRGFADYCKVHGYCFDNSERASRDVLGKQYEKAGLPPIYVLPEAEKARWVEAIMPIREDWVNKAEAAGAPGRAILEDVLKFAKQYSYENWPVGKEYEEILHEWGSPGH